MVPSDGVRIRHGFQPRFRYSPAVLRYSVGWATVHAAFQRSVRPPVIRIIPDGLADAHVDGERPTASRFVRLAEFLFHGSGDDDHAALA